MMAGQEPWVFTAEPFDHVAHHRVGLHRGNVLAHYLADALHLEWVSTVLADEVSATAGDFFRKDRSPQQQYGDGVRCCTAEKERQQEIELMCELKREDHRRKRHAHG